MEQVYQGQMLMSLLMEIKLDKASFQEVFHPFRFWQCCLDLKGI